MNQHPFTAALAEQRRAGLPLIAVPDSAVTNQLPTDPTEEIVMTTSSSTESTSTTSTRRRRGMVAAAVLVLASAAGVTACASPGASQERRVSTRSAVAPVTRDSAAPDGGYRCLVEAGGGRQCLAAEGIGTSAWPADAPDGGYACLRDTGNAGGECDNAMLPVGRPAHTAHRSTSTR